METNLNNDSKMTGYKLINESNLMEELQSNSLSFITDTDLNKYYLLCSYKLYNFINISDSFICNMCRSTIHGNSLFNINFFITDISKDFTVNINYNSRDNAEFEFYYNVVPNINVLQIFIKPKIQYSQYRIFPLFIDGDFTAEKTSKSDTEVFNKKSCSNRDLFYTSYDINVTDKNLFFDRDKLIAFISNGYNNMKLTNNNPLTINKAITFSKFNAKCIDNTLTIDFEFTNTEIINQFTVLASISTSTSYFNYNTIFDNFLVKDNGAGQLIISANATLQPGKYQLNKTIVM